jgi:SAM-dependent methyltransferase
MSWAYSDLVAEVYGFDLPLGHTVGDVEYYRDALHNIRGRILEPACGTGRMMIPLLEAGHKIDGADHSPEMLDACRQNLEARGLSAELYVADMESFVRPATYEAVILPAGSIRNLDGRAATLRTLQAFHTSLVSGGLLLIDLIAPRFETAPGPMQYWSQEPYVWTRHTSHLEFDPVANRTTQFQRYEKWRDGELIDTRLHRFCLQHWGLDEFRALLEESGFEVIGLAADYRDDRTPTAKTGDWTYSAVRR